MKVEFPEHHSSDIGGYSFDHAVVNDEISHHSVLSLEPDGDVAITAVYRQEVLISVVGGEGSGVYGMGQTVTVSAPERHVVSFLVREVFERWDGLEHGSATATFAAGENMEITAVYRTDYTYLMVIVAAPLLAGSAIVLYRMSGLGWAMKNVIDQDGRPHSRSIRKKGTAPGARIYRRRTDRFLPFNLPSIDGR